MPDRCPRCRGYVTYERDHVAGTLGTCVSCGWTIYVGQLTQAEAEAEMAARKAGRQRSTWIAHKGIRL